MRCSAVRVLRRVRARRLDQPVQRVAQLAPLAGQQRAARLPEQLDRAAGVRRDVVAQRPAQLYGDALARGHAAQELVHLRDQLLGLLPARAQGLPEVAEDVLLEQPALPLGEQLRVAGDGGGEPGGECPDRVLTRIVPPDDGECSADLDDARLAVARRPADGVLPGREECRLRARTRRRRQLGEAAGERQDRCGHRRAGGEPAGEVEDGGVSDVGSASPDVGSPRPDGSRPGTVSTAASAATAAASAGSCSASRSAALRAASSAAPVAVSSAADPRGELARSPFQVRGPPLRSDDALLDLPQRCADGGLELVRGGPGRVRSLQSGDRRLRRLPRLVRLGRRPLGIVGPPQQGRAQRRRGVGVPGQRVVEAAQALAAGGEAAGVRREVVGRGHARPARGVALPPPPGRARRPPRPRPHAGPPAR